MRILLFLLCFLSMTFALKSQSSHQTIASDVYQHQKEQGLLEEGIVYVIDGQISAVYKNNGLPTTLSANPCEVIPETANAIFMPPGDDSPSINIQLPFQYCFYGTLYSQCWLNYNGNITLTGPFTTFTAAAFPSATVPAMVAPFWGDVDTRGDNGTISYMLFANYAIFTWNEVGYFNQQGDKRNTFQLIITDGTSPVLPDGKNTAFYYGDMQWTTGSASGGFNGFGGTPATVGANRGNGVNYIQFGRFDQPGTAYDGPFGANDGVDWLDFRQFFFNTCTSQGSNIDPIAINAPICDTFTVCVGTTFDLSFEAIAVEPGQIATITPLNPSLEGFDILVMTEGNTATFVGSYSPPPGTTGFINIPFLLTDNGTPQGQSTINIVLFVTDNSFNPPVIGQSPICPGASTVLSISGQYDTFQWNLNGTAIAGAVNSTFTASEAGTYTANLIISGCQFNSAPFTLELQAPPIISITGDTHYCFDTTVVLTAFPANYPSYEWSNGATDNFIVATAGSYTVTVTDSIGCTNTSAPYTVTTSSPSVSITGLATFCEGSCITLTAEPSFAAYEWSNGTNLQTVQACGGPLLLTVTDDFGCQDTASVNLTPINNPMAGFSSSPSDFTLINVPISFLDETSGTPPNIALWEWSANGIVFSNVQNPTQAFDAVGAQEVMLIVTNDFGCKDTIVKTIIVGAEVEVPNIITPGNGDGLNDVFKIQNIEFFKGNTLVIMNRWGNVVYETSDYQNNFDGGKLPGGTYYYILSIPNKEAKTGSLTIIK